MNGSTSTDVQAVISRAAQSVAGQERFWLGLSGEVTPGEQVAGHLEAVLEVLSRRGWNGRAGFPSHDVQDTATHDLPDPDDESLSVKTMIRALLRTVRDSLAPAAPYTGPLTLTEARYEKAPAAFDTDVYSVADRVLDELVRAYTGCPTAQSSAWITKQGRTFAQVRTLLLSGAEFARLYGPR